MSIESSKFHCVKCGKERSTSACSGCLRHFCYNHFIDHHQELNKQFDELEVTRDLLRQTLTEQISHPERHFLIRQINKWEEDSIKIIQQTASHCRQSLFEHRTKNIHRIEINLAKLTDQLRETRQENDFNEIDLNEFKDKLKNLEQDLNKSTNVSIQQDSTVLVKKISLLMPTGKCLPSMSSDSNAKWKQFATTIAGEYGQGNQLNQLYSPFGICLDDDNQTIYIADCGNHRVIQWKYNANYGQIVAGGNGAGDEIDQLNYPTDVLLEQKNKSLIICDYRNSRVLRCSLEKGMKQETIISNVNCWGLAIDKDGNLYVSDWKKNEVRRWRQADKVGTIVAGGHGAGDRLNQLDFPTYIFVDGDYSVYVSDSNNHRVMKWTKNAKEGIVVAGGQGQGDDHTQLSHPEGVFVDHFGNIYVADSGNNRVMFWSKDSGEGSIIVGGNGRGDQLNQFNSLNGISFDRQGNLFVVDKDNNRVQKFVVGSEQNCCYR